MEKISLNNKLEKPPKYGGMLKDNPQEDNQWMRVAEQSRDMIYKKLEAVKGVDEGLKKEIEFLLFNDVSYYWKRKSQWLEQGERGAVAEAEEQEQTWANGITTDITSKYNN